MTPASQVSCRERPYRFYAVAFMFVTVVGVFVLNYPTSITPVEAPLQNRLIAAAAEGNSLQLESLITPKWRTQSHPTAEDLQCALRAATMQQHDSIVAMLLARGVDPNGRGQTGGTPLMGTIDQRDDLRIARRLIAAGADVNATDNLGRTALMDAVAADNLSLVRLLLESGADVHIADCTGQTALSQAQHSPDPVLAQMVRHATRNLTLARKPSPAGV